MKGTWQGSGTWQTSGPDLGPVARVVAVALVVVGLVEWLVARIWWVVGGTVVLVALAVAAFVALIRRAERREARRAAWRSFWTAREAFQPSRPELPQAIQAPAPPAIVNNYGPQVHIYGRDGDEAAARIIRQAFTGSAGGIATAYQGEQAQIR